MKNLHIIIILTVCASQYVHQCVCMRACVRAYYFKIHTFKVDKKINFRRNKYQIFDLFAHVN